MTPELCKSCVHRFNDMEEGQTCRHKKYASITLESGRELLGWGIPPDAAFDRCKGRGYQKALFGKLLYWLRA